MLSVVKEMRARGGPPHSAAAASSLSNGSPFGSHRCSCRSRLDSLALPLTLPLPCASLGICVRQVTVAPAVRAHHGKLHFKSVSVSVRERYRNRLRAM